MADSKQAGRVTRATPSSSPLRSLNGLHASVSTVPGVGPKRLAQLGEAGISTIADLLGIVPSGYTDRRTRTPLHAAALEEEFRSGDGVVTIEGRLKGVRRVFTRRRGLTLVRGRLVGADGSVACVWFNQPYLARTVDEDRTVLLHGKLRQRQNELEFLNPRITDALDAEEITAHYPAVGGLGDGAIRRLVTAALALCENSGRELSELVPDPVPARYLRARGLPSLGDALRALHKPSSDSDPERLLSLSTADHDRLLYGELFALQAGLAELRRRHLERVKNHTYRIDSVTRQLTRECLPFRLTNGQKRALGQIVADLRLEAPMLRLLQGDVGCGKTVVGAVAALLAAESGVQVAFLSPTELLAEQMLGSLRAVLPTHHEVGLLSASSNCADEVRSRLAKGTLKIVSGTHALFQESTEFQRLGLVVIDEQHRFGVEQRLAMTAKGDSPDLLLMSATPIPRSLALAVFGDLDLSIIDEMPPGRGLVTTELAVESDRRRGWQAITKTLEEGGLAFVVFPRIEEGEANTSSSLEGVGALYEKQFPGRCARLSGRTNAVDRQRTLEDFRRGRVPILLATTVIEVGIDVPDASLMLIEGADRFGLSQLHQLRGRVGRGSSQARCIAFYSKTCGPETLERLRIFASEHDGFALAEKDLRLRGPGDLLGVQQSGGRQFPAYSLESALRWLEAAREDARDWIDSGAPIAPDTVGALGAG